MILYSPNTRTSSIHEIHGVTVCIFHLNKIYKYVHIEMIIKSLHIIHSTHIFMHKFSNVTNVFSLTNMFHIHIF